MLAMRWKLKNLANLNKHGLFAFTNQARTTARKNRAAKGKENLCLADSQNHISVDELLPPDAVDLETDPCVIDVPKGEEDPLGTYGPPEPDSDPLDSSDEPSLPEGCPWTDRKPPTKVMALEALDAIKLLLYVPLVPGKQKRIIPTNINGWSWTHLKQISEFLNLYTGQQSKTCGQWMELSVQAEISSGRKGNHYGAVRGIRDRAQKYILEQEVPVNPFGT
ncbi:hypothetical protein B0H10DRAFT_1953840 [Mycena sp. CBHHK59/15]|nr:hypothetical protein B0H10DRAFT_1953840 [Mycena sp. CBHHK59/15]